jgi:hypothetical protein
VEGAEMDGQKKERRGSQVGWKEDVTCLIK